MTEAEIMKALECHAGECENGCEDCPFEKKPTYTLCNVDLAKDALDLINRKNAEIEDLGNRIVTEYQNGYKTARAEAIKEFYLLARARATKGKGFLGNVYHSVRVYDIEEIAKEMGVEL